MNRKVLFMCLMVLFLGMMAGSAFAQVELLTNTGFEDGINPLAPPWWNQNSWGQGSAGQAVDGVEGPTGTRSGAKMWQMSGAAVGNTNGNCVEQGPVFEAWAGTFNGSAWVRVPTASVDNPVSVGFRFWLGTTANGYLFGNSNLNMTTLTTGDWTEITCSVVASTPCTQAYFDVKSISNPDTSMITYVDDASITITQYAISGAITLDDLADPTGTVVTCSSGASTIVADSSGDYSLLVGPGTYTVTASKALYTTTSVEGVVVEDEDVLGVDIELPKVTTGFISGTITDESGPVAGIIVTACDFVNHSLVPTDSAPTGIDGKYSV
ncbi:MAG: carboxypeptidase-like regulatory domain-containing protein, partial [Armatimonadetes bacterium]|nr:carboxypeptidase-like regulatory domain-containing protein [Armatimonadota bacterium]